MIRRAALDAHRPCLNIVPAASWTPNVRVPNTNELRYLVYTTVAYGAQGISFRRRLNFDFRPGEASCCARDKVLIL